MKKIFAFLLLAALLTACSSSSKPTNPQITIKTNPGKEFKVTVESNPSTGYHWEIVGELDENIVELVSKEFNSASDLSTLGSGGVDVWTFKAVRSGKATITLGYYSPSNTPTEPEKTETFSVEVR